MALQDKDFTPTGLKVEGTYENDRNAESGQLFEDMVKEVYGATKAIVAHHITYVAVDMRKDPSTGFTFPYQVVEEIPSADTLIFDHGAAQKIWGDCWKEMLVQLAMEPVETRDKLLDRLYYSRKNCPYPKEQAKAA